MPVFVKSCKQDKIEALRSKLICDSTVLVLRILLVLLMLGGLGLVLHTDSMPQSCLHYIWQQSLPLSQTSGIARQDDFAGSSSSMEKPLLAPV